MNYYRYYIRTKRWPEKNYTDNADVRFSDLSPDQFICQYCKSGFDDEGYESVVLVHEISKDDYFENRFYSIPIREYTFYGAEDQRTEAYRIKATPSHKPAQ